MIEITNIPNEINIINSRVLKETSLIDMKYNIIKKFIDEGRKLEREILEQLNDIRKTAMRECDEEKYLYTIAVEKELKHSILKAIDNIYHAETIYQALDVMNDFNKTWIRPIEYKEKVVGIQAAMSTCSDNNN